MNRLLLVAAFLVLACSSAPTISAVAAANQAPCVDPRDDARARYACDPVAAPGCDALRVETVDDLDGDGARDTLVAIDELCGVTGNCAYDVYLSGNGCARHAGEVGGVAITVEPTSHGGVRDLSGYWKGGCVAMEGTGSTWAFDGKQYRVLESYECACPDESPAAAAPRDPRCPGP